MNVVIRYRAGYKYQLAEDHEALVSIFPPADISSEFVTLTTSGHLTIKEGYAWDGCSGPTKDDRTNMRGGLVHDALYGLMREGLLAESWRKQADTELRRICREDGMNWFRCWYYFRAVEDFAASAAKKGADPYPILTAP